MVKLRRYVENSLYDPVRARVGIDDKGEGPDLDLDTELTEVENRAVLVLAAAQVLDSQ